MGHSDIPVIGWFALVWKVSPVPPFGSCRRRAAGPALSDLDLEAGRRGGPGEVPPPGLLANRLARGAVVLAGRAARPSRANVRHPAVAQLPMARPFVLDGLPGTTPRRPRSVAGEGRAFGACCFAGCGPSPPYAGPYAEPYAGPFAGHPRTPRRLGGSFPLVMSPRAPVRRKDLG
jgi:hypothetical protein